MPTTLERMHGAFAGAAIGDALGAATELRTAGQIREHFGGPVRTFVEPPSDTFARGRAPGQVTDDFSQAMHLAHALLARDGDRSEETGREAILSWWDDEQYRVFAGPTTRAAIDRLHGATVEEPFFLHRGAQATNGAAMRVFPVGGLATSVDDAVEGAVSVSLPTHDNHLAVAGAATIAAGVWAAIDAAQHVTLPNAGHIVRACLLGAERGETIGRARTHEVAGASVHQRLRLALTIAEQTTDVHTAAKTLADQVGAGIWANEAVPAAVAIASVADDPFEAIVAAVNGGDDTDTVATMVGALVGAASGIDALPERLVSQVQSANGFDLAHLAADMASLRNDISQR